GRCKSGEHRGERSATTVSHQGDLKRARIVLLESRQRIVLIEVVTDEYSHWKRDGLQRIERRTNARPLVEDGNNDIRCERAAHGTMPAAVARSSCTLRPCARLGAIAPAP